MVHVVSATLFRAPVADPGAQITGIDGKIAVPRQRVGTQATDRGALDAAGRAIITADLTGHMREAIAAGRRATVAGGDAFSDSLGQMMAHFASRAREQLRYGFWAERSRNYIDLP
jgi:hypothetical protein